MSEAEQKKVELVFDRLLDILYKLNAEKPTLRKEHHRKLDQMIKNTYFPLANIYQDKKEQFGETLVKNNPIFQQVVHFFRHKDPKIETDEERVEWVFDALEIDVFAVYNIEPDDSEEDSDREEF